MLKNIYLNYSYHPAKQLNLLFLFKNKMSEGMTLSLYVGMLHRGIVY